MAVRVRIDRGSIDRLGTDPTGPVAAILTRAGERVRTEAVRLAPVDTGRLRSSIRATPPRVVNGRLVVEVGTDVDYGLFVHEGTGIYGPKGARIFPKRATLLRFTPKGASSAVYAPSVAGMRKRPFLVDALNRANL